jgi:hypothetical protein
VSGRSRRHGEERLTQAEILRLQQTAGNQAVLRLLRRVREAQEVERTPTEAGELGVAVNRGDQPAPPGAAAEMMPEPAPVGIEAGGERESAVRAEQAETERAPAAGGYMAGSPAPEKPPCETNEVEGTPSPAVHARQRRSHRWLWWVVALIVAIVATVLWWLLRTK